MTNNIGTKTIAAIFNGYTFPAAGEYIFDVAETAATHETWDATNETVTEDPATYKVHLYVKNTDNGLAIDKVTVEDAQGNKVDPTDVDPTDGTKGFSFTNVYTKELVDDDDTNKATMVIRPLSSPSNSITRFRTMIPMLLLSTKSSRTALAKQLLPSRLQRAEKSNSPSSMVTNSSSPRLLRV